MSPWTISGPTDGENGTATPLKRSQCTCLGAVRGTSWWLLSGVHARALTELVAGGAGFVVTAAVSSWPFPVQPATARTTRPTTSGRQALLNKWGPFRAADLTRTSRHTKPSIGEGLDALLRSEQGLADNDDDDDDDSLAGALVPVA
ncbi:hypothetical protein GCM10009780_64460 [Actinomadura alba]